MTSFFLFITGYFSVFWLNLELFSVLNPFTAKGEFDWKRKTDKTLGVIIHMKAPEEYSLIILFVITLGVYFLTFF